ncbi:MAG TPA: prepilin-type N-terminal cleavage/methylation domain-containing protein [Chthoniobacteraceae bacterium]|nr:prepilin-type N-terminal cleavage/methylation domain-containing protein [Chthoniobacteraceae bacterium]
MTSRSSRTTRFRAGFSMVELLVTLAVLAVLVVLASVAYRAAVMRTRKTASVQTLKGIGIAVASHIADHNGAVPGPTNTNQGPYFKANKLVGRIWPYLGYSKRPAERAVLPEFVPAHWRVWLAANGNPDGVQLYKANCNFYYGGETVRFFGYLESAQPYVPGNWSAVTVKVPQLSKQVVLQDYRPTEGKEDTPPPEGLQDYVTSLYLDWHVEIKEDR